MPSPRLRSSSLLAVLPASLLAIACAPDPDAASDPPPDAAPDAPAGPCDVLPVGAASVDLPALRSALVAELWAAGHTGASADVGPDGIYVRQIRAPLADAPDLVAGARAWLEGLGAIAFDGDELVPEVPPGEPSDAVSLVLLRARVGPTPARFARPAASLLLLEEAGAWRVASLTVWPSVALAGAGEAAALAACTPEAPPPDDGVRAHGFEGLTMRGCAPTGTYAYTPGAGDAVAWHEPVAWEALADDGDPRGAPTRWRIVRPATLTIAPANHWPGIEEADCLCDDVAGFELVVDVIAGTVLRYRPGVRCVVC